MKIPESLQMWEPEPGVVLPKHPEFYFRLTGEWKGWNDFLCSDSLYNDSADEQEDALWESIKHLSDEEKAVAWDKAKAGWSGLE